jgi:hypothetical protein
VGRLRTAVRGVANSGRLTASTHTRERVVVEIGEVIVRNEAEWKYGTGVLRLRVARIRDDLNQYYEGWMWVEGYRLPEDEWMQALIKVSPD